MGKKCRKLIALLVMFAMILQFSFGAGIISVYAEGEQGDANAKAAASDEVTTPDTPDPEPQAEPETPSEPSTPDTPSGNDSGTTGDNGTVDGDDSSGAPSDGNGVSNDNGQSDGNYPSDVTAVTEVANVMSGLFEDFIEGEEDSDYPAVTLSKTVNGVTVTLKAPEGALPEGVKLSVKSVNSQAVFNAVEKKIEANGKEMTDAVAFDVTPLNKEGKEIQPKKAVQVTFSGTSLETGEGGSVEVYRVSDDASSVTAMGANGTANKQTFKTNHFTIYVSGGSASNPNGDGLGPNTQNHRYVLKAGQSVTLKNSSDKNHVWSVTAGQSYVEYSTANVSGDTFTVTNKNTTQNNQNVTVQWERNNGNKEYYYITVEPQQYTVEFYFQEAGASGFPTTPEATASVYHNGSVAESDIPTHPEYTDPESGTVYIFSGWFSDEACTQSASLTGITKDTKVYGKYLPKLAVTFKFKDVGEESWSDESVDVPYGSSVTAPSYDATKAVGDKTYYYSGWCTDEECTSKVDSDAFNNITETQIFYSKYVPEGTLTYHANTNDPATVPGQEIGAVGSTVTVSSDATRAGYALDYWSTEADGSGDRYAPGEGEVTLLEEGVVLYAQWTSSTITITYHNNYNGAEDVFSGPTTVAGNSTVTLIATHPATRTGDHVYFFTGWATSENGSVQYYPEGKITTGTANIDLYAQWVEFTTDHLSTTNLTIDEMVEYYNADEYELIGKEKVNEGDNPETPNGSSYIDQGYIRVGSFNPGQGQSIYAYVGDINASGIDAGTYTTPLVAPLYSHHGLGASGFQPLGRIIPINNGEGGKLIIKPAQLTVYTDSAEALYTGDELTANGAVTFDGINSPQPFTHEGTTISLYGSDTLNIRTTGSQTEEGSSDNTYEIVWGTPQDWTGSFPPSTAKQENYEIIKEVIGKLTIYKIPVEFEKNAGSDDVANMPENESVHESPYVLPDNTPTREHYTFLGWGLTADATENLLQPGDSYEFDIDDVDSLTFYAIWKTNTYKLTFDPNGGTFRGSTEPTTFEYEYGETISVPEAPVRDGYEFVEWQGSSYQPGDSFTVEEDHTFTAVWKEPTAADSDDSNTASKTKDSDESEEVDSGDSMNFIVLLVAMITSALALLALVLRRRTA